MEIRPPFVCDSSTSSPLPRVRGGLPECTMAGTKEREETEWRSITLGKTEG